MNVTDIQNDLVDYLKTIPSIKSCTIVIKSYGFKFKNINNTQLEFDDEIEDVLALEDENFLSLLVQADIKLNIAQEISEKLLDKRTEFITSLRGLDSLTINRAVILLDLSYDYKAIL